MSLSGKAPALWIVLALTAATAAPQPDPPAATPPDLEIEGVSLGQSFEELDDRFDLSRLNPLEQEGRLRYSWRPPPVFPTGSRPAIEGRVLRSIVFLFGDGHLVEVTASYASSGLFTRMGLEELYGEPTSVLAPPRRWTSSHRRQRPEPKGKDLIVWIEIWTWEWEEATLTVTGEHYTDPNAGPTKGQHFFHFQLATSPDC